MRHLLLVLFMTALAGFVTTAFAQTPLPTSPSADPQTYLADFTKLCRIDWPKNRSLTIVCHGHSVPAGYFKTPAVHTFEAYPHLLHAALSERFPHAVINVIVTAIGGEDSEQGAKRFVSDVLSHRPDVVTIDYALNDRRIGLDRARKAWSAMIEQAQAHGVKVLLLTPTPDISTHWDDPVNPLDQQAAQIRELARTYHVGLVDSLAAFHDFAKAGGKVPLLMAQPNHPNAQGHQIVVKALLEWFP